MRAFGAVSIVIWMLAGLLFSGCGSGGRTQTPQEVGEAPRITKAPEDTEIFAEERFTFQPEATGSAPLTWDIDPLPEGMTFDLNSGRIDWTPTREQAGGYRFTLMVRNVIGNDQVTFRLTVRSIDPPQIVSPPRERAIFGIRYTYQVVAEGAEPITFSLRTAPEGMTIDPEGGLVTWQPTDLGRFDVEIAATNPFGEDTQAYQIAVERNPDGPVITSRPITKAYVDYLYQYEVVAEGAEPITFRLEEAPAGMQIEESSGIVTWIATREQVGTHPVTIRAESSLGYDRQSYEIEVPDPDTMPPLIVSIPPEKAREGEPFVYDPQALGAQPITWSFDKRPIGMTLDEETGHIEWVPNLRQVGFADVELVATNAFGLDKQAFRIVVEGRPPEITTTPPTEIGLRLPYVYEPEATGTPPFFWELETAPEGMTIDPQSGVIEYYPLLTGTYPVKIVVVNAFGQGTQEYDLVVVPREDLSVDPDLSEVLLSRSCLPADGVSTTQIVVIPRDPQGNTIGPQLGVTIDANLFLEEGGEIEPTFTGPVIDVGDGTYTRELVAPDRPFGGFVTASVTLDRQTTPLSTQPSIIGRFGAPPTGGTGGCPPEGSVHVRVLDETGNPLPGAFVMIGPQIGDPFEGNVGFSDGEGEVVIEDPRLSGPFDLTVGADRDGTGTPDYRWFSLFQVNADSIVVRMKPFIRGPGPTIEVIGNLTADFEDTPSDIFFGFALPAMSAAGLIAATVDSLLAPGTFYTIAGFEVFLFGNTAVPEQTIAQESVAIDYRLPFAPGPVDIAMVAGSMPLADFIEISQNSGTNFAQVLQEVLARFEPLHTGLRSADFLDTDTTGFDIAMTNDLATEMRFDVSFLPSGLDPVALSGMMDPLENFFATGMQIVEGEGSIFLPTTGATNAFEGFTYTGAVIASDLSGSTEQKSVIVKRDIPTQSAVVTFRDFYKPPRLSVTERTMQFSSPIDPRIDPPPPPPSLVTSVIELVELVTDPDTGERYVFGSPIWETMAPGSLDHFTLPVIPSSAEAGGIVPPHLPLGESYLWRVRFSALANGPPFDFNRYDFETYAHRVTHASEDATAFRVTGKGVWAPPQAGDGDGS